MTSYSNYRDGRFFLFHPANFSCFIPFFWNKLVSFTVPCVQSTTGSHELPDPLRDKNMRLAQ